MPEIETDYEEVEIEAVRPHEQQTGAYIMVVPKKSSEVSDTAAECHRMTSMQAVMMRSAGKATGYLIRLISTVTGMLLKARIFVR